MIYKKAMVAGQLTSKELVMYYLHRIAKYDQDGPKINSILEINPEAIFIAEALDHERKNKRCKRSTTRYTCCT